MVETIAENFYRIEVPLPKNPLKAINSYVITGPDRNLVIDTGMNREECCQALQAGFAAIGLDLANTDFLLTHMHADHCGLASALIRPGCKAYASRQDGMTINAFSGPEVDALWGPLQEYAVRQGFPADLLAVALKKHPGHIYRPAYSLDFTYLAEGDVINAAEYYFRCVFTPGHTRGHICLYEPNRKILISGDHILGDITPNISQWIEEEDALAVYFASLDKIAQLEVDLVLPGHRSLFTDCRGRINELKAHHSHRLEEVLRIVQDNGPLTAYEIAMHMSWDIRGTWADFPVAQKWFAHGEAIAHIKYLQKIGQLVCLDSGENLVRYCAQ